MSSCSVWIIVASCVLGGDALVTHTDSKASMMMLVAGTTSSEEQCLIESIDQMSLGSCSAAIAAGDGRELWSVLPGGQLMNVASERCATSAAGSVSLSMSDCTAASAWKLQPNGQVQVGGKCLSQKGGGAGTDNVAVRAAAVASSSADTTSHGAAAAIDADVATFWASKPGEVGPVDITLDLGERRNINHMKIAWEFPAQSFAVSVSVDGERWTEVYATDTSMVEMSHIPLSAVAARKVRVEMRTPHQSGSGSSLPAYGIKSIVLLAPSLEAVLDDCAIASQSRDARDKYFAVSVSAFDPTLSAALRAELPALSSAKEALSSALSKVAALPSCGSVAAASMLSLHGVRHLGASHGTEDGGFADTVGSMNDVGEEGVRTLLASARAILVNAREALR